VSSQFVRFIIVGGVAAAANIGSRIVFDQWMAFVPAIVMAFFVGLSTAFVLNRSWVFIKSGKHWLNEAAWFAVVNLLGLAQIIAISWVLARHVLPTIGLTLFVDVIAHSIGVVVPIVTSYLGHKHITFKGER
jgi:putative flippase GtrA